MTSGPAPRAGASVVITGMVSTVNNGTYTIQEVTASNNSVWVAGYYDDGILTFTSGVNSGLSFQVRQWDGITLKFCNALFVAPAHGESSAYTSVLKVCVAPFAAMYVIEAMDCTGS